MLTTTLNAKRLTSNAKRFFKYLSLVTCHLSLVFLLSGCSAIGESKPAALQVTSVPEASVFLDGKHLGKTPFFSDQLKAGEHLLKITVSEASFVDKVTLTSGTLTVVNRELANNFLAQSGEILALVPDEKGLFISSMPNSADLTIDGKLIGKTPALVDEIEDGEHKVLLAKAGYQEKQFSIKTSGQYQLVADVTLASQIAKGVSLSPATSPVPAPQKVEITQTPQGFLRVRSEPSLASTEIGRVKTGDQLEVIQETKDWIKIKFEGKQGWVASQYTKKLP
jgi:uncharacterized protein YgiM (DUF1202 family)